MKTSSPFQLNPKTWLIVEFAVPYLAGLIDANLSCGLSLGFLIWHWCRDNHPQTSHPNKTSNSKPKPILLFLTSLAIVAATLAGNSLPKSPEMPQEYTELIHPKC